MLKPIVSCGACRWCREGAINHCPTGRLVGRDMTGGFAERFAVPAAAAVRLDADLSDEVATLTEPLANAVHVASRSVEGGDRVFVIGAGPIGVLMVKAAFLYGAARVLITDPVADRLRLAAAQDAEIITGDDPAQAVIDATDGEGADVVIDAAGYEATWAMALRAVRTGGRIEEVGLGSPSGTVDFFAVLGKEATITGSYAWGDVDFESAVELMRDGAIDVSGWITTMPLADGQRAFQELVGGAGHFKVVLTFSEIHRHGHRHDVGAFAERQAKTLHRRTRTARRGEPPPRSRLRDPEPEDGEPRRSAPTPRLPRRGRDRRRRRARTGRPTSRRGRPLPGGLDAGPRPPCRSNAPSPTATSAERRTALRRPVAHSVQCASASTRLLLVGRR